MVLAVLAVSAVVAFLRGLVQEVLGVGAWIGAALAALALRPAVVPVLRGLLPADWPDWVVDGFAIGGIFILTQMMAVGLGSFRFTSSLPEWLLMILAIAAIAAMFILLGYMRRRASG